MAPEPADAAADATMMVPHVPTKSAMIGVWVSVLVGCGGGDSSPVSPSPQPTPPPSTFAGRVNVYDVASHEVAAERDGMLTATLTWTGAADLDLYVTDVACSGYPPDQCAIQTRSVEESGTREEVVLAVRTRDRRLIWVDNFSHTEAVDYTLVIAVR